MTSRPHVPVDVDAVLFDFYGTLVDGRAFTVDVGCGVLLESLASDGVVVEDAAFRAAYRAQLRAYVTGHAQRGEEQHNTAWVERALELVGEPRAADEHCVVDAVRAYFDRYASVMTPLPGAREVVRRLASTHALGLVSNFTDATPVRRVLEREGLTPHFGTIVISADMGKRKPRAELFQRALDELGVSAARTLFVGDDPVDDIAGARALGLRTAWVKNDCRPALLRDTLDDASVEDPGADVTIASVAELPALLA